MPKWVVSEFVLDDHLKQTNKQTTDDVKNNYVKYKCTSRVLSLIFGTVDETALRQASVSV